MIFMQEFELLTLEILIFPVNCICVKIICQVPGDFRINQTSGEKTGKKNTSNKFSGKWIFEEADT